MLRTITALDFSWVRPIVKYVVLCILVCLANVILTAMTLRGDI